ncbi:hypothetical protein Hanom_Chr01g00011931 [Helianthus anomalus]
MCTNTKHDDLTKNLWFSCRIGVNVAQNFSISELMSPFPATTSMNFFLSGASFIATYESSLGL